VQRVHVTKAVYYGLGVGFTVGVEESVEDGKFEDLEISYCGNTTTLQGDGFDGKRMTRCLFSTIRCHDNVQRGMDIRGDLNIYENIWCYNNGATGISFRALGTLPSSVSDKHYIKATDCYAYNNGEFGFFIANNEAPLTGFESEYDLVNCHAFDNGQDGFQHRGSDMLVRYSQCTSDGNGLDGFRGSPLESNVRTRGIYIACHSRRNGRFGFLVNAGLGKHQYTDCIAEDNGGIGQVGFEAPNCSWRGGIVNASGRTRGLFASPTAFGATINGGDFTSGADEAIRFEAGDFTLSGAKLFQTTGSAVRVLVGASGGNVIGNDFTGVTGGTPLNNAEPTTNVIGNIGLVEPLRTPYVAGHGNYLEVRSSFSGSPVEVAAVGSSSSIDLALVPKGSAGRLRFGSVLTTTDSPITGYIEIKDAGGTIRKLALIN
jgi:hypothetical protein